MEPMPRRSGAAYGVRRLGKDVLARTPSSIVVVVGHGDALRICAERTLPEGGANTKYTMRIYGNYIIDLIMLSACSKCKAHDDKFSYLVDVDFFA